MALTAYAILHAVQQGHMPLQDAVEALEIPAKNVKMQVTYFGDRLGIITQTLNDLTAKRYETRDDLVEAKRRAAETLGVSVRQVNRFLERAGGKPRPESIKQRENASVKATERQRQHRLLALDVLYGRRTLTEAANISGRHERSIRRVLDELPVPVRYPDYGRLSTSTRYALAKNIEENVGSDHLQTLVNAQINRGNLGKLPQTMPKPLISIMIAWLEGETDQYDPGFEHFMEAYRMGGVELRFWERFALADELRHLL